MSASRLILLRKMHRHARVAPIQLWRLYQMPGAIDSNRWQTHQQIECLKQIEVAMHGKLQKSHIAAEFSLIDELCHAQAGGALQSWEVGQRGYGWQSLKVTFQVGSQNLFTIFLGLAS